LLVFANIKEKLIITMQVIAPTRERTPMGNHAYRYQSNTIIK
jgi:hypothetical protein